MRINQEGVNLIKEFEGLKLEAYVCPAGVLTIGYGTTKGVTPGVRITEREAEELLRKDLEYFEDLVRAELSHIPLTENQFSALVSLCYNCGSAPILPGTTIRRALESKNYARAADGFLLWNKAGGEVLQGLVRRRSRERELFLKKTTTTTANPVAVYILTTRETLLKSQPVQSSLLQSKDRAPLESGIYLKGDYLGMVDNHYRVILRGKEGYLFKDHVLVVRENSIESGRV